MASGLPAEACSFLDSWLGSQWSAEPLRGDASVRDYYRVTDSGGKTYMIAYYPEELRFGVQRFMKAYDVISPLTPVPAVIRYCDSTVAQLDVGDDTLFDLLHRNRSDALRHYREAVELLIPMQRAPAEAGRLNPPFDVAKFVEELEMANEFYVARLMGAPSHVTARLSTIYLRLAEKVASHPYVLCHRDYHGQNIHIFLNKLYIIDYQDMRMGPDTYDLASLLRDRGVARIIGEEEEATLVEYYRQIIEADRDLSQRYYESLLQRSIKILGTFARQAITRDREHYLEFVPSTLESVRFCLKQLPEHRELASFFPLNYR